MSLLTELSKQWNYSLKEVKEIQDFMNERYHLAVIHSQKDGKFYGVLCEMHETSSGAIYPLLVVTVNKPFDTADEAAQFLNKQVDTWKIPDIRAKLMDVPQNAYRLLKKLPVKTNSHTQNKIVQAEHVKE